MLLGSTTVPPTLSAGLITMSLCLHKLSGVNCCGDMFLCLLRRFVFSMMFLVIRFRYMSSSGDCSASSFHERVVEDYVGCPGSYLPSSQSILKSHVLAELCYVFM